MSHVVASPKTIQIFLPFGDPQAIRVAEITTRIVRVMEVPRSLLQHFQEMPESTQVGLYFLFGEDEKTGEPKLYIGQSGNVGKRLGEHNEKKDFWNRALVVVSLTNSLTQTHAAFLEWLSIKRTTEAGRYQLDNANNGSKPHTPPPLEADCIEIFETSRTLLATLGYPVYETVAKPLNSKEPQELFYCKRAGCAATGEYTSEGFVVLSGSQGRIDVSTAYQNESFTKKRAQLIAQGKLVIENGNLTFKEDILFATPSGASAVVLGAPSNGWTEWKSSNGKTLNDLKRLGNL